MKCPECGSELKKAEVNVYGAAHKVVSYQCPNCNYFEFEPISSRKVLDELRTGPLKIRQRIVKLSGERLGIYFNNNVVDSLDLKKGEELFLSVPDKKHIVLEIRE